MIKNMKFKIPGTGIPDVLICVPYTKTKHIHSCIEQTKHFDFNKALESVYPLIDIICTYLPSKDLMNVAQVSSLWKEGAKNEIFKRRQYPSWIVLYQTTGWFIDWNYPHRLSAFEIFKSKYYNFSHKEYALIICTTNLLSGKYTYCSHNTNEIYHKKSIHDHIQYDLLEDKSINYATIPFDNIGTLKPTNRELISPYYITVFLPLIKNVRIKQFHYTNFQKNVFGKILKNNEKVECLLIFGNCGRITMIRDLLEDLGDRQSSNISFGASSVHGKIDSFDKESQLIMDNNQIYCLAFLLNKTLEANFYSASCVISKWDLNHNQLLKFKENVEIRDYSYIFLFGGDKRVLKVIKEKFPTTLPIQMHVNVAYGINNYRVIKDDTSIKKQKLTFNLSSAEVVVVFMTWGKLLSKET